MKTRTIILLVVFVLGMILLWFMSSFTIRNACEYANSNLEYIKSKIEAAIVTDDLQVSKYNAYKALNGIEKTKANFLDCGCEGTIESLEGATYELKQATKAETLETSKKALHLALETTLIGIKVLRIFEQEVASTYGNDILVLNTKDALNDQDGLFLTPTHTIREQVHSCLLGFESSLDKVVSEVECEEAHRFINNIHEEARLVLLNTELSKHKKQYHQRVKTLAQEALNRLGKCDAK
ncbi:hypothetical protein J0X14_06630 [Muricauda sp. CAU 1633]|uniref:hypothetical protein n=1 Tax=Allomuricauda sp. CAU 1633 TaxID=2816036 RepID=UPI001A8EE9D4|nr:hypothetical protein [Muricauda sp. CAU 1633]MBO0321964.1 hypothetical protein [Muricauda sp. CAU 1633]